MTDLVVIGGGPAGMLCAVMAAQRGLAVTLLDRNLQLGRKLRITGKGRCNVTNACDTKEFMANIPGDGRFLYSAMSRFGTREVMAFFEGLGVPLKVERGNRVFPVSDNANDIADALARECERRGVRVIRCSARSGHGHQTLAEAVGHSCNPALIAIGQKIGREKFYDYLYRFGIMEPTGIDLPYENSSNVWPYDEFHITQLATASFGQRFNITPIQLITAFNAVVNGGYLYTPHVVDHITDPEGNTVYTTDTTPVRQVISESTSKQCAEILEGVVSKYTGKNAYQPGYRIGGKTGTSQTLKQGEWIVSFVGFAPADDPDVIVLVIFDRPKSIDGVSSATANGDVISGGGMAAPVAGELLAKILDYRGYEKAYSSDDLTGAFTAMPDLTGMTETQADQALKNKQLSYRVVGSGDTVTGQIPRSGNYVPQNSKVILYMGEEAPTDTVDMPDLRGQSPKQAIQTLNDLGLFMRATGTNGYYTSTTVCSGQSVDPGTKVRRGYVVDVQFSESDAGQTADNGGELPDTQDN